MAAARLRANVGHDRGVVPHLYIGEEAVAAGVIETHDVEDAVVATYRKQGHALLRAFRVPVLAVGEVEVGLGGFATAVLIG